MPVLMYHSISDDAEAGVNAYYRVATSPARFAEQMQWIADVGCQGVSLEEGMAQLTTGKSTGRPLVAITFDDGFRDFYTAAWPVLQRHQFTATMYLPTALISEQRRSFRGKECLTWSEVRGLRSQGIHFGSHTVNHLKLYDLPWREIENELSQSKQRIEQELGEKVASFAYPYAFPQEDGCFTARLTKLLCRQGYHSCATTLIGCVRNGDDAFQLKRLPANSGDGRALFLAKLAGAYDWMGRLQTTFRRTKRWTRISPARL